MWRLSLAIVFLAQIIAWEPAAAQCGGHGEGGHGQAAAAPVKRQADQISRRDEKALRQLLADPNGRKRLVEEVLADPALLQEILARAAERPEGGTWIDANSGRAAGRVPSRAPEPAPYVCPMHPEVRDAEPGVCPKCGMALRKEP